MSGFKVNYFREFPPGYQLIDIDDSVPLSVQERCPACSAELYAFCTLEGSLSKKRIRLGYCQGCGYAGYIERPTKEWITAFYADVWGKAFNENISKKIDTGTRRRTRSQEKIVRLFKEFSMDKTRVVCDIGCGSGGVLKELDLLGFKNLVGVESSRERSEIVRSQYGYSTIYGNFEDPETVDKLRKHFPIGVFFTNHVLEHVYHPQAFIKTCSNLQGIDDYLILAVPYGPHETPAHVAFWLPHLHSFSAHSIEQLLMKYGYQIIDDSYRDYNNFFVISKKVVSPKPYYKPKEFRQTEIIQRFSNYFEINTLEQGRKYLFSWMKNRKGASGNHYSKKIESIFTWSFFNTLQQELEYVRSYFLCRIFRKGCVAKKYSFVLTPLDEGAFPQDKANIEIQYEGHVQMLVK